MDFKLFAEHVKEARRRAGLSQAELAEKLGVGQNTISNYENATGDKGSAPKLETAAKMAEVLDVSLDWLVGYDTNKKSSSSISDYDFLSKLIDLMQSKSFYFCVPVYEDKVVLAPGNIQLKKFGEFVREVQDFLKAVELLGDTGLSDEMRDAAISGLKKRLLEKYSDMLVPVSEINSSSNQHDVNLLPPEMLPKDIAPKKV